jgi:hypothetical protein
MLARNPELVVTLPDESQRLEATRASQRQAPSLRNPRPLLRLVPTALGCAPASALALLAALPLALGCSKKSVSGSPAPSIAASRAAPSGAATPSASAEPDTVTQASPAYEPTTATAPVATLDEIDGAKLRQRHIERLKGDRSAVTVLAGESALELGQHLCEAVVAARPPATPGLV